MKEFNITGVCIQEKHYMVDISKKIEKIAVLVEKGQYFTINRARQYGKTTTLFNLFKYLKDKYYVFDTSFEGLGDYPFASESNFCESITGIIGDLLEKNNIPENIITNWKVKSERFDDLGKKITELVKNSQKEIVLIIDEVDKSSNNQLFLNFLGMLRNKYLEKSKDKDYSFKSVILAGVYDIKNMKIKIRPDAERKFNSPWNIAADFNVDMSFNAEEISTMLNDYECDHQTGMDIALISNEIYNYTSGYPFLVSKLCKTIEEDLDRNWTTDGIKKAVNILLSEENTLFDDLIKNMENNSELKIFIEAILIQGEQIDYNIDNPIINLLKVFGIIRKNDHNKVEIDNKIFELRLTNYLASKMETSRISMQQYNFRDLYITPDNILDIEGILLKFQQFIKENYHSKDEGFYEKQGRLLLIAFVKPIINGYGFYYVENQISYERRMDMVITYNNKEYILEFKIWYGQEYHKKGLLQFSEYLETKSIKRGYLVVFNFNKKKKFTNKLEKINGKEIFTVMV